MSPFFELDKEIEGPEEDEAEDGGDVAGSGFGEVAAESGGHSWFVKMGIWLGSCFNRGTETICAAVSGSRVGHVSSRTVKFVG